MQHRSGCLFEVSLPAASCSTAVHLAAMRTGTPAAELPDDVTEEEKTQRLFILQDRITHQAMAGSRRRLGTTQRVLVEGGSRRNVMGLTGRTQHNRVLNF